MRKFTLFLSLMTALAGAALAQSYVSVPLESSVYKILDLAVQRGLCPPLPGSKPYTRAQIFSAINEILNAEVMLGADATLGTNAGRGALNTNERIILEKEREKYTEKKEGLDLAHGTYFGKTKLFKTGAQISAEAGLKFGTEVSQALTLSGGNDSESDYNWGGNFEVSAYLRGDIGKHFSYGMTAGGFLLKASRTFEGEYNTYYDGFKSDDKEFYNRELPVYSQPLAYFPFTYKKVWDSSVFYLNKLDSAGYQTFPEKLSGAYALGGEMSAAFFDNTLFFRAGRLNREWAAMSSGSSLVFNGNARPFLAVEGQFQPVSWFNISSLTGELEYFNSEGIKTSSWSSQNAFSITMLEFNIKNFLHIDFGDAVVWPKRFELGYPLPIINSFFYQNNIGDFDNLSMFFDIKANISKTASVWFSFYNDEMELNSDMGILDRTMFAFQAGTTIAVLPLPFAFIKLTYTKIEPYCYTHNRNFNPWYNDYYNGEKRPMETAYMNNGVGIGYYLPPNSDEILLRFETMTKSSAIVHFQYQMIRHGADFGPNAVDGSSYFSELDPEGRDEKVVLKKYFLRDGAYQWFHVLKTGAEYTLKKLPLTLYAETGIVFSYFTNIDGPANQGNSSPYHIVDEAPYTKSTNFILTLGIKLFPDF
ncbi:MAG: hypothetical protein LBK66_02985 [Spirochaetaceae bacterium]|jgi:hypothetical protein|nr:hypothetical protein [Spirochaetaceae bacterium]